MVSKTTGTSKLPDVPGRGDAIETFCDNEIFDLLGNRRRRFIVWYLHAETGPVECCELARRIAAWENDATCEDVTPSQYQSVYNSLYQTHLPRLEAAGFVEYDGTKNLVYPTTRMAEVDLFIDSVVPGVSQGSTPRLSSLSVGLVASVATGAFAHHLYSDPYVASTLVLVGFGAFVIGGLVR